MDRSRTTDRSARKPFSPSATSKFIEDAAKTRILVKDHNYFRDRTWNNSYLASGKIFSFYHQKENELIQRQADLKERMRWQQFEARNAMFEERAILNREAALSSLQNVTRQRMTLQKEASQPVMDTHLEGISRLRKSQTRITDLGSRKSSPNPKERGSQRMEDLFTSKSSNQMLQLMNQKPSLLWNKVTKLNSKNLDLLLTPEVLKRDRRAFIDIRNRQKAEEEERQLLEKRKKFLHDFIRWKGKAKPLGQYQASRALPENRLHKFLNHDDPALNGLLMNDVLRMKGAADNTAVRKILKANSFLRTIKAQERTASPRKTIRFAAHVDHPQSSSPDDNYCTMEGFECDFESFEESLARLKKFKEGRYPRINLEKVEPREGPVE